MVEMSEAVQKATAVMRQLYPEDVLHDLLLEEIEQTSGPHAQWLVTMGFTRPRRLKPLDVIVKSSQSPADRAYKRIKIDATTGEFLGMSDRILDEQRRR